MEKLGWLSIVFFGISALVYFITMFFTGDVLPESISLLLIIILPLVGLLLAFKAKGGVKMVGIIGNALVLVIAVIIPAVSSIFWNTP